MARLRGIILGSALWALCRYRHNAHATGAPHRLNRFQDAQRDQPEKYSLEELVAEFGAAFLCGFAGLQNPAREAQQASYIAGWSRALRDDQRLLVRAAAAAQRAADYVRGKQVQREQLALAEQPVAPIVERGSVFPAPAVSAESGARLRLA